MNNLATICSYITNKKKEVPGKKAFQKIMYFITAIGVPTGLKYSIYHYGPYSSELDYNSDNLELMGALSIIESGHGYKVLPGSNSVKYINEGTNLINKYKEDIDSLLEHLPEQPLNLELWSTIHYVAHMLNDIYDVTDEDQICNEIIKIKKDKFTEERIYEALSDMKKLGYI